jgi:hypothetical protein
MTMKTPKRKTPARKRLPALNPLELEGFKAKMDALKGLSPAMKNTVMDSLNAAANPNAENPLVVIRTLEAEEQNNISQASAGYMQLMSGISSRGRMALLLDSEIDVLAQQEEE